MTNFTSSLADLAESNRIKVNQNLDKKKQVALGQFLTPSPIASFMASLFHETYQDILLLDPAAGVGSLTAAFLDTQLAQARSLSRNNCHQTIAVDVYEVDDLFLPYLESTMALSNSKYVEQEITFRSRIFHEDFVESAAEMLWNHGTLFQKPHPQYTHCILNPPYRKIRSDSKYRQLLKQIDVETSNLYSAFLAIAIKLLRSHGQLVAIIPRSFCNGVYFKHFRQLLLTEMAIQQIHVFTSRTQAFKENDVLQENIILHAVKNVKQKSVTITSSSDGDLHDMTYREVPFEHLVKPNDGDRVIHIVTNDMDQLVVDRISTFSNSLDDLGITVSTGPVVDFRAKDDLRQQPTENAVPLIYPSHFVQNQVRWPTKNSKKPNAIVESSANSRWLMPNGWYVLTRRLSSTEERRRIVAAIHNPEQVPGSKVGFENHVNVFHRNKHGLDVNVAKGLTVYLNSTLVDLYFRQFSGHTQVNATDLRMLYYPDLDTLSRLGETVNGNITEQEQIDTLVENEIARLTDNEHGKISPMKIQQKIQEALTILDEIGMPRAQRNERSALTLLALLALQPDQAWEQASAPLVGITPIMEYVKEYYGRNYAPNTRETFRRQTMHQFMDAGIVVPNPDDPQRPINSPKWVYQVESHALALFRTFGTSEWETNVEIYFSNRRTLAETYAKRREMLKIPLAFGESTELYLTPGRHSELIQAIIEQFGPRFAPGAEVLYIGDTGTKLGHFAESVFQVVSPKGVVVT